MSHVRRAASLVELLVVMSACMVVMTLTSELACRIMRIQVESRAHVGVERNALRLAERFRRDVRQARAVVTSRAELGDDVFVRLHFPDAQRVDYSRHGGTVLRQASGLGGRASRDELVFPATCVVAIQEQGTPQRLVLTVTSGPDDAAAGVQQPLDRVLAIPVSLRVEAVVGQDLRFAASPARQETSE